MASLNYISRLEVFQTAKGYVQRHRHLKKGTKEKVLRTELKKMTTFTRKTMNYRTERKLIILYLLSHS